MVLNVRPGVSEDFQIPSNTKLLQFSEPLSEGDYRNIGVALSSRPDVGLRVYGYHGFADLDFLAHFSHVRKLSIDLWSLTNLDGLRFIEALDEFTFGRTKTKANSLKFLTRFPTLRKLYLEEHSKDIDVISGLASIERLTLRSITLPGVELLSELPNLRHLEIKLGGTKNLAALASLSSLKYLELWLVKGLADLSMVAQIPSLEFLFLQAQKNVTSLPSFGGLKKLRGVYLETMKGLTSLEPIAEGPALESLILVDMPKLKVDMFRCFVGHPTLRAFSANFGSLKRNAEVQALLGLPQSDTWLNITRGASA